jgi:hypothetical protein
LGPEGLWQGAHAVEAFDTLTVERVEQLAAAIGRLSGIQGERRKLLKVKA